MSKEKNNDVIFVFLRGKIARACKNGIHKNNFEFDNCF